ncbi:MAG TPA: PP2C family protein-serine/threonine phosphatase, partial [Candidatus Dormibacteraeota bacterium]|nr:PP2C family protein-serine/threonine phosphatase [Candidatus Dormibacteraeota bacterium]
VRSALVTAMIRALVEELKPLATEPGQFLTKLNHDLFAILKHTGSPMLTTAFYLVADCHKRTLRYANAGHPKPLLVRRSESKVLPFANASGKGQPALGLFAEASYETSCSTLAPQDLLVLFTDGLYEVQNAANELYTQDLLVTAVRERASRPATKLFEELLEEIIRFSQGSGFTDDVCLVSLEFTPP